MIPLIKISRPRFWLYVLGPFIVGAAAAAEQFADLLRFEILALAVYFLLPANLLIYGINDIFDYETDKANPKKTDYEMLVRPEMHRSLWLSIALLNLPFIAFVVAIMPHALGSLAQFLMLAVFYSAPPVRAKQIPFLDSIFNLLYAMPGLFAYQILTGGYPSVWIVLAAWLWTAAMHAFSAIPDIESDRQAGLNTIATRLGPFGTHLFCLVCYAASGALCLLFAPVLAILAAIYILLVIVSFKTGRAFEVYRWFPPVNTLTGFILFWYVAWQKVF